MEGIALLREAILRLTQHVVREAPTATPTSQLTKLGPDDDVEAYLEVFERTTRRENWPEERDTVSHPTSPAGEPRPIGRNRPAVSRPQTGDPSLLWT